MTIDWIAKGPPPLRTAVVVTALFAGGASAQFQYLGVAAGDASSDGAVLWTRAVDAAAPAATALLVEVSTDATFTTGVVTQPVATDAARDYTAKVEVTGLLPVTSYYYRFDNGGLRSGVGTFRTAPAAGAPAPVRFAFSGDCDGLMRPYPVASVFPTLGLDYFVFLGDTIYETASGGSPAAASTGTLPAPSSNGATPSQLFADYARKYREQFIAVNNGGQACLQPMFSSQGNYTLLDNHELGNRQYSNGGAPAGGSVGGMPSGAGEDARLSVNDVNGSGTFINEALGFTTLIDVFLAFQPVKGRGPIVAPADPRTDGTTRLYFAQPWGRNAIFVNVDDRSYRDIRMKAAGNTDDTTSPRADNPLRTMLGATQLAWLESTLLAARESGVIWKFVAMSSPIDQLALIGSGFDSGKSWMGGYRAERNALLQFLADNHIENVVFLATDDHENRINEVLYSPTGETAVQSSYLPVPRCFTIVCGPLGATGPDTVTDHSFTNIQIMAAYRATLQALAGVDPMGLSPTFPGLHDVVRSGDPTADLVRAPVAFYSPDTFNLATLDVSADGATLRVRITGIESRPANSLGEYDAVNNPVREILSFQVDAFRPCTGPVCGQFNSVCATLLVNGVGLAAQGPIQLSLPIGVNLSFDWHGPPGSPLLLAAAAGLVPGQRLFGAAIVDLDIATLDILFSAFQPTWGPLFYTDELGQASHSFRVPASLHGHVIDLQGAVFDGTAVCSQLGFMTTASFAVLL